MNNTFTRAIFALVIGLILVLYPQQAGEYFVIAIGILFVVPALVTLIGYLSTKPEQRKNRYFPIDGCGALLFGLLLMIAPGMFANFLTFVIGAVLLMGGVHIISSLMAARHWMPVPVAFYILPALVLIAGLVGMVNPMKARSTAFIVLGATALFYGVSELLCWYKFSRHRPRIEEMDKTIEVVDAEVVDDDAAPADTTLPATTDADSTAE